MTPAAAPNLFPLETQEGALQWLAVQVKYAELTGPFSEPYDLTPALAQVLITLNPHNRPVRPVTLRKIKADLLNGAWVLNGQSVIVADDGNMNDGQHRCLAVIATNITMRTFITFGVTRESRLTCDTGTPKKSGDFLSMQGVMNANKKAAVAGLLHQWEEGKEVSVSHFARPTKQQVQAKYLERTNEIEASFTGFLENGGKSIFGSTSMAAFVHLLLRRIDAGKAGEFLQTIVTGDALPIGDPRLVARERLITGRKMRLPEKVELLIRAWNYWREGRRDVRSIAILNNLPRPK